MPHYKKGELFDAPGVHIVTASSFLSQDDTLVMGLGAAYAMKCRYPDAPRIFGTMLRQYCGHLGTYGLLIYGNIGILQYKCHFNDRIDSGLISYGLKILAAAAEGQRALIFNITHPGLGYDKTGIPAIDFHLSTLPPNIHIWQR